MTFRATIRRLGGTMVLAIVLAFLLILVVPEYLTVPLFVILWPTLFFTWPYLRRGLHFLKFPKVSAVSKAGLALFLVLLLMFGPLLVSYWQARRAHDAVRIGMNVPEVLQSVTGWHVLSVVAHVPDPDYAGASKHVHAISFGNAGGRTYITHDFSTGESRNISEPEAIGLFQEKLHESQEWHFQYTYMFMNQFVLFDVDFTPDGRVSQVSSLGHHDW